MATACEDSQGCPEDVTMQVLRLHAPWFEEVLTPAMYYHDPRPDDDTPDDDATVIDSSMHGSSSQVSLTSDCSCRSDGFEFDSELVHTLTAAFNDMGERANQLAYTCLHTGFVTFSQLQQLSLLLPIDAKPRKHILDSCHNDSHCQETRCFTAGAYIFGGEAGIRTSMRTFFWVTRLLCCIVKSAAGSRPFTTVTLSLNQQSGVHVDAHNSRTYHNIVIPAGYWDAGELWVYNDNGCNTFPGTELQGDVVPVRHPYTMLDATQPHAVFDWTGERTVVIGFHIRDAWRLQKDDLALLADAGFHVRTCERVTDPYMSVIEVQ
ncbi:unnamed protein product [Symbiodinium sp. CCMP2592]|nr:unnamed protein product [Symbiodinium sp. CCMP2592]